MPASDIQTWLGGVRVADVSFWRKKMQKKLMINEPADRRKDSHTYKPHYNTVDTSHKENFLKQAISA